jgi:predicted nucleic acid-binding protein
VTERIVCDASAVVAVLLDAGPTGQWAADIFNGTQLFAPTLMPFECANVVRRLELAGVVSTDQAAQAHADLLDLSVELLPYEIVANRVWELRSDLSCYDAVYVALAEVLDASVITLDHRIQRASGLRCSLLTFSPS